MKGFSHLIKIIQCNIYIYIYIYKVYDRNKNHFKNKEFNSNIIIERYKEFEYKSSPIKNH